MSQYTFWTTEQISYARS